MSNANPPMRSITLKAHDEVWSLIDRAAKAKGKTRSQFIVEATRRAAEDAIGDQIVVSVDAESYDRYLEILDRQQDGDGFMRLMGVNKPWSD